MNDKQLKLILTRIFGLILTVTVGFLFLTGSRYSKLVGYFVYMSVACLIIPLPSPPYVIGMGKIFHPGVVAIVGSVGNCIALLFEYHFLTWIFSKSELQRKVENSSFFQQFAGFFNHAAFICLIITGFLPLPLEPVRIAAILSRYSVFKYVLATFIGRLPRNYLLALLGESFQIPNRYLIIILMALLLVPGIVTLFLKRFQGGEFKSEKSVV
ncbi:MAG: VTT domain-containing protein [bacterium]|nr:MAG: VTT domain-containing protein [bacterium]